MNLFTDEWRETRALIHVALRPYFQNADMGAARYEKPDSSRFATTKWRMRKDKVAVMTLGCWDWENQGGEPLTNEEARAKFSATGFNVPQSKKLFIRTTALVSKEQAQIIGQELLAYLERGEKPEQILEMPTYPGYEDLDKEARENNE